VGPYGFPEPCLRNTGLDKTVGSVFREENIISGDESEKVNDVASNTDI
jgi:hypothetical protein